MNYQLCLTYFQPSKGRDHNFIALPRVSRLNFQHFAQSIEMSENAKICIVTIPIIIQNLEKSPKKFFEKYRVLPQKICHLKILRFGLFPSRYHFRPSVLDQNQMARLLNLCLGTKRSVDLDFLHFVLFHRFYFPETCFWLHFGL